MPAWQYLSGIKQAKKFLSRISFPFNDIPVELTILKKVDNTNDSNRPAVKCKIVELLTLKKNDQIFQCEITGDERG